MWKTNQLQKWATKLGIGEPTGIDLPGEGEGLVPSKKWRDELFAEGGTDRPWSAGDNIQLAIGQGDLQTDPLQMAIAYAALGNGGTIVTPHVGMEVEDAAGRVLQEFDPPPRRKVKIDPATGRRSWKGCTTRRRARRHVLRRLRRLPDRRSPARPAPRSGRPRATSPGTSCWRPTPTRVSSPW